MTWHASDCATHNAPAMPAGECDRTAVAKVHDVKSVQPHFDDVCSGRKTAELRRDDRGYAVGDVIRQHEIECGEPTGRIIAHKITHKLAGDPWLAPGYCMLSLARIPEEASF